MAGPALFTLTAFFLTIAFPFVRDIDSYQSKTSASAKEGASPYN